VRDRTLHAIIEAFTADAAGRLAAETAGGAEIPFEVIETEGRRGTVPLYCYRPLTQDFITNRLGLLTALPTYAPASRALAELDRVATYLNNRGEPRVPREPRERADAALLSLLARVFGERSDFGFDPGRFELAYGELERALYDGRCATTVLVPLLGIALDPDTTEIALGEGLSLVRGDALPDAPADAIWGDGDAPHVLVVLTTTGFREPPISLARARFRRVLSAVRLFDRGGYALGPLAWARTDTGPWRVLPLGSTGRPRLPTLISAEQEDELRAFCSLLARRTPGGELAWALARFEMGCERVAPFEALTDYLLALRALLEPEGPASGRLAQRLAVICARAEERAAFAQRTARTISLERAVIAGLAPAEPGADRLVEEVAEHLRALLRDAICGHLDADLVKVADELLTDAAVPVPA
jgi:hypothetical protein